jgi:hypothetical protein
MGEVGKGSVSDFTVLPVSFSQEHPSIEFVASFVFADINIHSGYNIILYQLNINRKIKK